MSAFDIRDGVILALVTSGWITATVFLFQHPGPENFATWGAVTATITGVYHWLYFRDQKVADAC